MKKYEAQFNKYFFFLDLYEKNSKEITGRRNSTYRIAEYDLQSRTSPQRTTPGPYEGLPRNSPEYDSSQRVPLGNGVRTSPQRSSPGSFEVMTCSAYEAPQRNSPGGCNGSVRSDEGYHSTEYHELTPPEDSSDDDSDNYVIDYRLGT